MNNQLMNRLVSRFTVAERWVAFTAVLLLGLSLAGNKFVWAQPKVVYPSGPSLGTTQVSRTKPVVIVFSHPVQRKTLRYAIYPELPGTWDLTTNIFRDESKLFFIPDASPELETRYTIELSGITSLLGGKPQNYLLSFQTDALPVFASISPVDAAVDVMPDASIVFTFDTPLGDGVTVAISTVPELTFDPPLVTDRTATFRHAEQFKKSTTYTIHAYLQTVKVNYHTQEKTFNDNLMGIGTTSFSTVAAPTIQGYSPTGSGVDPGTTVRVEFKQAMDHDSTQAALSLSPAASGGFTWDNERTMIFTPTATLAKDQTYTVTVAASAKAINGVTTDENFSFTFTTLGAVKVASWSPGNGATGIDATTAIRVTFDQAVEHPSAESKFSIAPSVSGSFSWDGSTMIFQPGAALNFGTSYTATMAAGVQAVKGNASTSDSSVKFTTRNQSVMLNVPAYRQAHVYTCMIAAARSALAFRNVSVSEASIISKVGVDPTKWSGTWGGDNGVWGDPDVAIVGPLDNASATQPAGKQTTNVYWGYGSHWGPISKAMTSFGVSNEVRTGMTVQDLAQSIASGNPVVIWWVNGIWPSYEVRWKTPSGKSVRGVNGLHVQVVRGFTGSVENPVSFTVTDSGYGYPGRTFDIGTFKAKWKWFGNTGIIVK